MRLDERISGLLIIRLGIVVVVADPVVVEADDKANDDSKGAQALEFPCVVSGAIGKAEDVDWYSVRAKAGQRMTFSVWANRLENKIHDLQAHFDPILQLFDATGRELAADDNHDFADPHSLAPRHLPALLTADYTEPAYRLLILE